jgi:hypothetical protein
VQTTRITPFLSATASWRSCDAQGHGDGRRTVSYSKSDLCAAVVFARADTERFSIAFPNAYGRRAVI